jgi:hypothetical protein
MASRLADSVRQSPCPLHPPEAQPLDQALPRLASPPRGGRGNIVWAPNLAPMLAEGLTVSCGRNCGLRYVAWRLSSARRRRRHPSGFGMCGQVSPHEAVQPYDRGGPGIDFPQAACYTSR